MTSRALASAALLTLLAAAAPALAEHTTAAPPERTPAADVPAAEHSLDIDLQIGRHGFRLGGRLFGRDGHAGGAWLNGDTRPGGFRLDGRIERDGTAQHFRFDAEIDDWLQGLLRWKAGTLTL